MEFKHKPVMLNECIDALNIKPNGIYFDGTLGGAGHSSEILKKLTTGLLIATDKDEEALNISTKRLSNISSNFKAIKSDFKDFTNILNQLNIEKVDGILLDFGVSSYQIDNGERGFSYRFDAPLDMRMDQQSDITAYDIVNNYSLEDLTKIFFEYGEEPFSKTIAKNIVLSRVKKDIKTTLELVEIIKKSIPQRILATKGHPAKRIFQALRIEVNGELEGLKETLFSMIEKLNPGGRIAVLTFHSLEDRIVKDVFKLSATNCICPQKLPVCICKHKATIKIINKKPIIASKTELNENSRSSCAKLRIAEKI